MKKVTISYQDFIDWLVYHDQWSAFLNSIPSLCSSAEKPDIVKIEGEELDFDLFIGDQEFVDGSWQEN